ncbi:hypothetical protein MKW92_010611 [Papaver armeniacum]|nr:hypothetical protein MKW92_010611 [Papaver armeniacum]
MADIKNVCLDARVLYQRLVRDSGREIVITMQAIALWIFLEGMGFPNLVQKLLNTHEMVVNKILDEAQNCLGWVQSTINLMLVYSNRTNVITKVNETLFGSFAIAFADIIQEVSGMTFAQLNVLPLVQDLHEDFTYPNHYPEQAAPAVDADLPESKRAIFCTFTREYPVQQKELESFWERSFGEGCIEKISMQQVPDNEHPTWASVVFNSEIPVLEIMQGKQTAAISVNGKHVWAGSLKGMVMNLEREVTSFCLGCANAFRRSTIQCFFFSFCFSPFCCGYNKTSSFMAVFVERMNL